ncbi:hypothetical protein N7468_001399 [Penicillium chermesinum]|uniref:DUF1753-domain-containing protein n=1 Tax=Penicillium chermesinum TaxID=63820 RepID=A0A9W9PIA0_9EURO|nr:uncharacterized protein N7468_001399 [Penicillium chermesinum]KAJ5246416.1 hypothetical protein N7468_001399 [Penicillium chermesinum]
MGLISRFFRIPRPESFLYVMSLETGASLITLSLLLNKISGLYGLLALLTGYHLSSVQLSMYLYSLIALALGAFLFPHIRKQSPLECLALAWFYVLDSLINASYTAAFGVTWFLVVSQGYDGGKASPGVRRSHRLPASPAPSTMPLMLKLSLQKKGTSLSHTPPRSADPLSSAVSQPESFQSIIFISLLWAMRLYFIFVMLAFARQTLRLWVAVPRHTRLPTHSRNVSVASMASVPDIDREPFSVYSPDGQGWKGKLGRLMVSIGHNYWLGEEEDGNWLSGITPTMHSRSNTANDLPGPLERERRRRSGTGPPQPPPSIVRSGILQQPIQEHPAGVNVKMQDWPETR